MTSLFSCVSSVSIDAQDLVGMIIRTNEIKKLCLKESYFSTSIFIWIKRIFSIYWNKKIVESFWIICLFVTLYEWILVTISSFTGNKRALHLLLLNWKMFENWEAPSNVSFQTKTLSFSQGEFCVYNSFCSFGNN